MTAKEISKKQVDSLPVLSGLLWRLRHPNQVQPGNYNLTRLRQVLPEACAQVKPFAEHASPGKNVFVFGTLHYWIKEGTLISLALAGLGHKVTFSFLPYAKFDLPIGNADLHNQDRYTYTVLKPARNLIDILSLLQVRRMKELPSELEKAVRQTSIFDLQYILETEEVDPHTDLYALRLQRNRLAAQAALAWFKAHRPEAAVIPNGLILELGAVYQVARHLNIPVVTYEFNEEHEQLWLSQSDEIMRQNTDLFWRARGSFSLNKKQRSLIEAMETARQGARKYGHSERLWQEVPTQGSEQVRQTLGLDSRPLVLLATNVLGDSLILGRNVFTRSMAEWITRTIQYFAKRTDVQLLIRIHPGEKYTRGATMVEAVRKALPSLPENIHLIEALDKINTYDLIKITNLGLVYVTTTGLEMVMHGIPVIVVGQTHYRQRGFTLDPQTWDEYFGMLETILADPLQHLPTHQQVEVAWNYAYRFFFEYPRPFPWRLVPFWKDFENWPLKRVLSDEGQKKFGATFRYLTGELLEWKNI